jgi:DNA repair protein RadC
MTKRYQSGLVGMDVKPHRHRHIKQNRYRPAPARRWLMPALVSITAITATLMLLATARCSMPATENKTKTIRLRCLRPVFERQVVREDAPDYLNRRVTTSREVFELFRDLEHESREHFIALHLDSKNTIICFDRVSIGSLNAAVIHPRELFKAVLLSSAAAVILVHVHPSGDPTPSREDLELTGRLKECGELLGVRVLDHVIIGHDCFVSLADRGLM